MRIIAGKHRGRVLKEFNGRDIRPTSDRAKEALFNILQFDVAGCSFLDLYSGTGGIGLEAISRGAEKVVFVDNSRESVKLLKENLAYLKEKAEIYNKKFAAYEKALKVEADAYKEIRDALAVGYINEKCPDKYSGTDEEIINAYKADDKKSCNAFIKKANEDARFILPNASTTKIVCTFNARSLQNFFAHRCCNRAQWEIREVAEQMLLQCLEVAPHLFKNCGPSCLFGPCPEGNMCCGKQKEMRQKYGREK